MSKSEEDGVVYVENLWGPVVPELRGACKHFHLAKARFFAIPIEKRAQMTNNKDFIDFWTAVCIDKSLPMSLRCYAAAMLLVPLLVMQRGP